MGKVNYFDIITSGVIIGDNNVILTNSSDPKSQAAVAEYKQRFNQAVENMMTTNTGREIVNNLINDIN